MVNVNRIGIMSVHILLLSSCLVFNKTQEEPKIELYGIPLMSFTRIGMTQKALQDSSHLLAVFREKDFKEDLRLALSKSKNIEAHLFRPDFVRMIYKVAGSTSRKVVAIDKGGEHLMYEKRVYEVSKPLVDFISKYTPNNPDEVLSVREKRMYRKADYVPECCE